VQCVAVCCSVLKCVVFWECAYAESCSMLQYVAVCRIVLQLAQYFAVWCSVLKCVAVFCSVLQCDLHL